MNAPSHYTVYMPVDQQCQLMHMGDIYMHKHLHLKSGQNPGQPGRASHIGELLHGFSCSAGGVLQ